MDRFTAQYVFRHCNITTAFVCFNFVHHYFPAVARQMDAGDFSSVGQDLVFKGKIGREVKGG